MQNHNQCGCWISLPAIIGIAFLAGCDRRTQPEDTNGAESPAGRTHVLAEVPDAPLKMLIDITELKSRLDEKNLRVLDARPFREYQHGHIPGAVHVDVAQWKNQALADGGLHNASIWSAKVGALGIDELTNVVVYANNPTDSTRIWWTLKYLGLDNVAILDGGWPLWNKEVGEKATDVPAVKPVEFRPDFQTDRLAEIDELKTLLGSDEASVVDARSTEEFDGTAGPGARTGRIPGAVHVEWSELLDPATGLFKSTSDLQKLFRERGIVPQKSAITYCQTGGRASLDAFALELAGYPRVKNYYCSYQEWGADPEAPIEKSK